MRLRIADFQKVAETGIGAFTPANDKAIRIRKRAMALQTNPVIHWILSRVRKHLPIIPQRERPIA